MTFSLRSIDHVQLAMPAGTEDEARSFYAGVLRMREVAKPPVLAGRGGVWFESGDVRLHLGVDPRFHAATKAHPAILVGGLDELAETIARSGGAVTPGEPIEGCRRVYVADPFGNRIELMERV